MLPVKPLILTEAKETGANKSYLVSPRTISIDHDAYIDDQSKSTKVRPSSSYTVGRANPPIIERPHKMFDGTSEV